MSILKLKYDKVSIDMNEKDYKNFMDFIKWFDSLSDADQIKYLTIILGGIYYISAISMKCYKTINEERIKVINAKRRNADKNKKQVE